MQQLKCSRWTMLPTSSAVRSYRFIFSGAFTAPSLAPLVLVVLVHQPVGRTRRQGFGLLGFAAAVLVPLLTLVGLLVGILHGNGIAGRESLLHPCVDDPAGRRVRRELNLV